MIYGKFRGIIEKEDEHNNALKENQCTQIEESVTAHTETQKS